MEGKAWREGLEAAAHPEFVGGRRECCCSACFLSFIQAKTSVHRIVLSTFRELTQSRNSFTDIPRGLFLRDFRSFQVDILH